MTVMNAIPISSTSYRARVGFANFRLGEKSWHALALISSMAGYEGKTPLKMFARDR
jgi:hypothetical protein